MGGVVRGLVRGKLGEVGTGIFIEGLRVTGGGVLSGFFVVWGGRCFEMFRSLVIRFR